jgi:hypothetical protein
LAGCGILVGALTHLVWDAFTHENARGLRMLPWLEDPVVDIGRHRMGGVWLLQDASSLIGLLIVLALVLYGLRRGHEQSVASRPLRAPERCAWVIACAVTAAAASVGWGHVAHVGDPFAHHSAMALAIMAEGIAVAVLRGLATALLCTCLALDWRLRALRLSSAPRSP